MVEHLPSMYKALKLIPSPGNKKELRLWIQTFQIQ
jgi:hypothetical protein